MNKRISWGTPHRCQQRHYTQTQPCRSSVIMFSGVCPHRDIHSLLAGSPAVTASLSASQSAENTPNTKPDLSERSLAPNRPTFKHVNDYHRRLIIKCAAHVLHAYKLQHCLNHSIQWQIRKLKIFTRSFKRMPSWTPPPCVNIAFKVLEMFYSILNKH